MVTNSGFTGGAPNSSHNINYSSEPIRLFKSNFLESFTHIHPAVVPTLFLPVALFFLMKTVTEAAAGVWLYAPLGFVLGAFIVWTFIEYVVHRFVFHFQPRNEWQEKVIFLFHEVHHVQPNCKTRLVMPPLISVPGTVLFYMLTHWAVVTMLGMPQWFAPTFAGMVVGYIAYDMIHYATHHAPMKGRVLKAIKRHHMLHHFQDPQQRFGVTMPLWDYAFGTQPDNKSS